MNAFVLPLIIAFPFMWCGGLLLLSQLGGWARLAERYPVNSVFIGREYPWQSAKIGMVSYGSCLTLRVSDSGLGMSVMFPFRTSHPPIFIPWSEFHDVHQKYEWFIFPILSVTVGRPAIVHLSLPRWVGDNIPMSFEHESNTPH